MRVDGGARPPRPTAVERLALPACDPLFAAGDATRAAAAAAGGSGGSGGDLTTGAGDVLLSMGPPASPPPSPPRHVCAACRARLPSPHLLALHVEEAHDAFFAARAARAAASLGASASEGGGTATAAAGPARLPFACLVEGCGRRFALERARATHLVAGHGWPPGLTGMVGGHSGSASGRSSGDAMDVSTLADGLAALPLGGGGRGRGGRGRGRGRVEV